MGGLQQSRQRRQHSGQTTGGGTKQHTAERTHHRRQKAACQANSRRAMHDRAAPSSKPLWCSRCTRLWDPHFTPQMCHRAYHRSLPPDRPLPSSPSHCITPNDSSRAVSAKPAWSEGTVAQAERHSPSDRVTCADHLSPPCSPLHLRSPHRALLERASRISKAPQLAPL